MRVDVRYPAGDGALVLRTERNWDSDVQPVERVGDRARFDVEVVGPTLAMKPCLRLPDGSTRWSVGANYVLSAWEPDAEIYPYFDADRVGRVSPVQMVDGESGPHPVRVYTPPGYDENTCRSFPVVYMQDGRNLFFPEEAFSGDEWQVDETMNRLDEMNAIRKAIVVGVAPVDRMQEYTHPGYHAYGRFLANNLKPWVDGRYRTRPGPADSVVMGSSLGGVAAFHVAWEHPGVFGQAACLSATFGPLDDLFQRVATEPRRAVRFYLDSGWPRDNYDATNAMRDLLVARGWRLGVDLLHFSVPDGTHQESAWAARAHLPFQFFLGRAWAAGRSSAGTGG